MNESVEFADFIAENTSIDIIANQRMEAIRLYTGNVGPFRPLVRTTTPLWLALLFKRKHRCHIVCPDFLDIGFCRINRRLVGFNGRIIEAESCFRTTEYDIQYRPIPLSRDCPFVIRTV
jgi:hypothetical protein